MSFQDPLHAYLTPSRSAVIDRLTLQRQDSQLVVSYFVDHSRQQPSTCIEILRALVKQIMHLHIASNDDTSEQLGASLKAIFPSAQARPSAKAITSILSNRSIRIKSCIFVIDGIDALPEREINEFLDCLHEIFPSPKSEKFWHKLIVFCRHSLGRGIRLESIPSSNQHEIKLSDIQRDLFAFVDHEVELKQRRRPITDNADLIEETKRVLKAHCGKMWALPDRCEGPSRNSCGSLIATPRRRLPPLVQTTSDVLSKHI